MTRTVLCYGDSNTYGAAVGQRPDDRFALHERWPGVLAMDLGCNWQVIEEGLNGRTTVRPDPVEGAYRSGKSYLLPCLYSHKPLDVVAIMLGTNDLKTRFNASAWEIAEGVGVLVKLTLAAGVGRHGNAPAIVVMSPPPFLKTLPLHADVFIGAYEKSLELAARYAAVSRTLGVHHFDAGSAAPCSELDGFHLDAGGHIALGHAMASVVKRLVS